jgi:histidinol-phosphate phosphatase family protein
VHRAVFLDRDGVLNEARVVDGRPFPPETVDEVVRPTGVDDACRRLHDAGWLLVVVTNQPDIARGQRTRAEVDEVNAAVVAGLPIAEVVVCPHDDADDCACRKPRAGMLVDAARRWDVDLHRSAMVGDRWRDVEAGRVAGTRTVFIDHDYDERRPDAPDHVVVSLAQAADVLLAAPADDWDQHWSDYAGVTEDNPAEAYRRQAIIGLIDRRRPPRRIVDVGCGQGDLLVELATRWPEAELAGVELSAEGLAVAATKVPGARLHRQDLLDGSDLPAGLAGWADVAICSEVIEHVDDPARLLRVASGLLEPGGAMVVTVPGGPRTAFDRHIGHRRHYDPASLRAVLDEAGLDVEVVTGIGFPFFDLYKLVVLAQGDRLARDLAGSEPPSRLASAAMRAFGVLLRTGRNSQRHGWQTVAIARRPVAARTTEPLAGEADAPR